jgi:hypothetical protein
MTQTITAPIVPVVTMTQRHRYSYPFFLFLSSLFAYLYGITATRRHLRHFFGSLYTCHLCLADTTRVLQPLPYGNFARRSSQGYRDIKNIYSRSQNASRLSYSHLKSSLFSTHSVICTRTTSKLLSKRMVCVLHKYYVLRT